SLLAKFVTICQAIDYAHSRGVLHRDIKPDNILLGPYGETLVVDWGLAKTIESENASESLKNNSASDSPPIKVRGSSSSATLDGSAVGTPGFISPEQAMGRIAQLGPATDIYGLGATLFAILAGKAPVSGANTNEILEKSRRGELDSVSQHWSSVPAALSAICMKAMSFDESQRYNTCRELAVDVERWLADEPVSAHREPMAERASRFIRKHQTIVTSGVLLLLASTALLSAIIWFEARLEGEKQTAQYKELEVFSERRNAREQEFFAKINAIRERSTKGKPGWSWQNEIELQQISPLASTEEGYRVLREETARLATTPDIRKMGSVTSGLKVRVFAWSGDGKLLAMGQRTATALSLQVKLLRADTFEHVKTISFQQSFANVFSKLETDGVTSLAFSPDSQQLLIGTRAGELHHYELDRFTQVARWSAHEAVINSICVSSDGTICVTGSHDAKLKWWSLQNQKLLRTEITGPVHLLYSAEKTVYSFSDKVETYSIDPNESTKHAIPHIPSTGALTPVQDIGFLSVGESGLEQYSIHGRRQRKLIGSRRNDQSADAIEIGCRGQYAIVNYLKSCDLWDVVAGQKIASINGEQVFSAVVDPKRPRIVIADDEHVDWYEIRQDAAWQSLPLHENAIAKVCVASTADQIITSFTSNDSEKTNRIRKWQLSPIQLLNEVSLPPLDPSKITASHDGNSIAFIKQDSSTLCEMDITSRSVRELVPTAVDSKSIVFSYDDQQVWFDSMRAGRFWLQKLDAWAIVGLERQSKKQLFRSKNQSSQILKGYSHFCDLRIGKRFILASTDDTINLWDIDSNFEVRPGPKVTDIPDKLALFTSEAQGIAGTGVGGIVIFDTSSGEEVARTQTHLSRITALSTIGNHLVLAGDSFGEISVSHWNDKKLELLCRLGPFTDSVNEIAAIGSSNFIVVHINGEPSVRILNWGDILARWNQLDLLGGRELNVPQKDGSSSQSFGKLQ
ncbi:MAG TPA: serine/threonine-protein kinase, partial [Pirellula sp.]|nr:serine/threonine-protein kinase [Pirellula sp.]